MGCEREATCLFLTLLVKDRSSAYHFDMAENEYVLGTHDTELTRLGMQNRLWTSLAFKAWDRAGFAPGHRLLDIGCGPGFTTRDLAKWAGPKGKVVGADVSNRFLQFAKSVPTSPESAPITYIEGDVRELALEPESFDGAYARWVLCFVPDPKKVLKTVHRLLKPGAPFVVQDYVHYEGMGLLPSSAIFEKIKEAVVKSWRQPGGDTDVIATLLGEFDGPLYRMIECEPVLRIARPGTALWQWPEDFFLNFVPMLVEKGLLTPADREEFEIDWRAHAKNPSASFVTPPVASVIAVKR
jgi:SAM-dependent methyltransferase